MKKILVVSKKEWLNFFYTPAGYVAGGLMLIITNWIYWNEIFVLNQTNFMPYLSTFTYLLTIFIPAITMGTIADEKKNGNWEVLMSTPIRIKEIILGKFFGIVGYFLTVLLMTIPALVCLRWLGKFDFGVVVGSYFGISLLASCYIALGILMSSISVQAISGFMGTAVVLLLGNLLGQEMLLQRLPWWLANVASGLSLSNRVLKFFQGTVSLSDTVFFLTLIFFCLLVSININSRRK